MGGGAWGLQSIDHPPCRGSWEYKASTKNIKDLYALYAIDEVGDGQIALLDLGENESGSDVGIAIYTDHDGQAQRKHLESFTAPIGGLLVVYPITREELLDVMYRHVPPSVLLDGHKVAASKILEDMLKGDLEL